jgi:uncharacterized protein
MKEQAMNTTTAAPPLAAPRSPYEGRIWYREPYFWLVAGGPLTVIVACMVTITIAVKNPDPVLDRRPVKVPDAAALEGMTPEERAAALVTLRPAHEARNHQVTPVGAAAEITVPVTPAVVPSQR